MQQDTAAKSALMSEGLAQRIGASVRRTNAADSMARIQKLKGRAEAVQSDALRLEKSVGIAKARQDLKEDVEGVLDDLERRFHERSMGILESLLGAFLNDVLPRHGLGEQSVQMNLDTQRGLPALQVAVCNGDQVEDALRGRGGSVANVLSAGLRFIAIARTGGRANTLQGVRPFLVLDEADCWLSPDRVPAFSAVIHSLTFDLGVQVLMISHHDTALLKGFPVYLERVEGRDGYPSVLVRYVSPLISTVHNPVSDNGKAETEDLDNPENEKLTDDHYTRLTGIRLENFLSHEDSLIPLTPGVTVLTGDNDVGKSAVTEAFRAVAYNDSSDSVIRHGAAEARVSLTFADDTRITWTRTRKGSPKTTYRMYATDGDDPVRETPAPKDVPDWVRLMLGMDLRERMDVHIGNQKSPVFLLDQPPSQRAAILDIGRESQHLRTLRERWKHQVDEDRRSIREGEKQLSVYRRSLAVMAPLEELEEEYGLYAAASARTVARMEALAAHQAQWARSARLQDTLRLFAPVIPQLPDLPALSNMAGLNGGARLYDAASHLRDVMDVMESFRAIDIPDFPDLQKLLDGARLVRLATPLHDVLGLLQKQAYPALPELPVPQKDLLLWVSTYGKSVVAQDRLNILKKWDDSLCDLDGLDFGGGGLGAVATRLVDGYRMGRQSLSFRKALKASEIELEQFKQDHDRMEQDYQKKLLEFGACPFCGSNTHKEHHS